MKMLTFLPLESLFERVGSDTIGVDLFANGKFI
jgi:hypothetical protein